MTKIETLESFGMETEGLSLAFEELVQPTVMKADHVEHLAAKMVNM